MNRTPSGCQSLDLRVHVLNAERGVWDAVLDERRLERPSGRMRVGLEHQLGALGILVGHHGEPSVLAHRDIELGQEAQDAGVEVERLRLVVDKDAGQGDPGHVRSFYPVTGHRRVIASSGRVSMWCSRYRPCRSMRTRPAAASTSRCCVMAWRDEPSPCRMARRLQISNSDWPSRSMSSSRIARRVGSASAR